MKRDYIFLSLTGAIFLAMAIVFLFFPRSTFSEVERRELKEFPEFSLEKLRTGDFTAEISEWFSDTEPFRDELMALSMTIKKHMALKRGEGEEQFTFHQTADVGADMIPGGVDEAELAAEDSSLMADRGIPDVEVDASDNEESKMSKSGILIVGSGDHVRALMNYSGSASAGNPYIAMVNEYSRRLGDGVRIYSMVVPIAMEFYCPSALRDKPGVYKSQLPVINHIYTSLDRKVTPVNVYTTLSQHADEDIYLRTDHHWAPLGAYYAACEFAREAGVHVPRLEEFDRHVISGFVGTMYGYSKDISVRNAPEDFVYYTPKNTDYNAWFTIFDLDKDFRIVGEGKPHKSRFFKKFKNGSSNAYLTFMGSDFVRVKVETGVHNGRRLAIMKDSYGNALPGYLFGSFEEVHVLDFRYFPYNIVEYCRDNKITDFLFVNNIFNASSAGVAAKTKALLTREHTPAPKKPSTAQPSVDASSSGNPSASAPSAAPSSSNPVGKSSPSNSAGKPSNSTSSNSEETTTATSDPAVSSSAPAPDEPSSSSVNTSYKESATL